MAPVPLNINVGIMGHVDSGKTSLVKALSTTLSTASLDKNPQSQARGITIDLGFSAFSVDMPDHLVQHCAPRYEEEKLQLTLVDCPGHASLIRTIIGGAQIIDMMLLIVDAVKGIQTQTAECLVIGEITTDNLIIVLNKIDTIPEADREAQLEKTKKRIRLQLSTSKFRDAPIVCTAAAVGGEKVAAVGGKTGDKRIEKVDSVGLDTLVSEICRVSAMPARDVEGPFFFSVDHCFTIRGQGTVVTGTVLRGKCSVNEMVELPAVGLEKKVKSMQMFRKPCKTIQAGDRAGMCLAQLDAGVIERGIVAAPGSVPVITAALARVTKVRFFRGAIETERKFHITVGHATVVATCSFFGAKELAALKLKGLDDGIFDWKQEYAFQAGLAGADESKPLEKREAEPPQWCLLRFVGGARVRCQLDSLVIGSTLETSEASTQCRIAFSGRLVEHLKPEAAEKIKLFRLKQRCGVVARLGEAVPNAFGARLSRDVMGKDLFKKEANMNDFVGMKIQAATGEVGTLHSAFGKSGKFKVQFPAGTAARPNAKLFLCFKKYVFSTSKAMHQDDDCVISEEDMVAIPSYAQNEDADEAEDAPATNDAVVAEPAAVADQSPRGTVERLKGDADASAKYAQIIAEGLFSAEDDQRASAGANVVVDRTGDVGTLSGAFGKAGKSKVDFPDGTSAVVGDALTLHVKG
ncbi:putative selenocysteine-specific elongation factor, selB [Pelagophyceae sp. CCMP2097]|nr:putative selenocysteine-specific elongation factor, selB [Pelagophyceae sp. CCMP2097]|mmetsp:Transcript_25800/g.86700  ORF Transcript_25800/g.86700 Transcript_25800/m.86700 type:complete len:691 (+) Transcript_25800:76-2148(+)